MLATFAIKIKSFLSHLAGLSAWAKKVLQSTLTMLQSTLRLWVTYDHTELKYRLKC